VCIIASPAIYTYICIHIYQFVCIILCVYNSINMQHAAPHTAMCVTFLGALYMMLHSTATYCNTLQHTATHCNTHCSSHNSARRCLYIATHCNALQHTATHCNILQQHTAIGVTCGSVVYTLRHTATHCNTQQHTATHCNTLRHTATAHCNRRHLPQR